MVAARHEDRTAERQFLVDSLQKLAARQSVLLQLAHIAVVIVLEGIP